VWSVVILCIIVLLGCNDSDTSGSENRTFADAAETNNGDADVPETEHSIVGDWFACEDPDCTEISDDGTRLNPDGTWVSLNAPGGRPEADGRYCVELRDERGEYTWDSAKLTLLASQGSQSMEVDLRGNRATFYNVQMGSSEGTTTHQDVEVLRVESYTESSCRSSDNDPPPVGLPNP